MTITPVSTDHISTMLRFVNVAREAIDAPPLKAMPRGRCSDPLRCPISLAFRGTNLNGILVLPPKLKLAVFSGRVQQQLGAVADAWGVLHYKLGRIDWAVLLPSELRTAIIRFDQHLIPELIDPTS